MSRLKALYRSVRSLAAPRPNRKASATWGVVATVKEPIDLIVPFVCHHLSIGAASVALYIDDPHDPAIGTLQKIERVKLVLCYDAHWQRQGFPSKPGGQGPRQNANLRDALATTDHDWLVHIDADEFLWLPEGMSPEITGLRYRDDWLAIQPWERIWEGAPDDRLFSGAFRSALPDFDSVTKTYGDDAPFMMPDGLAGYSTFKPMIPARTPHRPVIHKLIDTDSDTSRPSSMAQTARILHFEGLTPIHFALKQLRYAAQSDQRIIVRPSRYKALREIIAADDVKAAALERFHRTYAIPPDTLAALDAQGALHRPRLDIEGAVRTYAPHVDVDFSSARIDSALIPLLDDVAADVTARRDALLAVVDKRKYL